MLYLKDYISASLREAPHGRNRPATLAHKLPQWMIQAKNRDQVLKAIERLENL